MGKEEEIKGNEAQRYIETLEKLDDFVFAEVIGECCGRPTIRYIHRKVVEFEADMPTKEDK